MEPDKKHEQYEKFLKIWNRVLDFCEGEDAVKARREAYLPKLPSQMDYVEGSVNNTLYDLFLEKATVWPGASKTLRAYIGILTRKQPEIAVPEGYDELFTISGEDIFTGANWLTRNLMQIGLAGILVDFPDQATRPFAIKYQAQRILNWEYGLGPNGRVLSFVSLAEKIENGAVSEVLHLRLVKVDGESIYTAQTFRREKNRDSEDRWIAGEIKTPLMNGAPMDFIPFVPASEEGTILFVDYPMLIDVTNLNKAHYQNDAEYRNALTFAGRPTPCLAGLIQPEGKNRVQLGTSTVLQFEPGGSWGMLGLDNASGIEAIRNAGQDLQRDMAIAGSRALTNELKGVEAAETAKIHREGEHGQLSTIARVASDAMTKVITIMAEWAGVAGEWYYRVNTDFNPTQIDPATLQTLWQMYMSGDVSFELLWHNMQRGELTPDLRTIDEEREAAAVDRAARMPEAPAIDLDEPEDEADDI
jgi:hypothetical protein